MPGKNWRGKSIAHGNGPGKPEGKTPLRRESHILLAGRVGRTGTARSTESCTDESAFSAASQAADESACGRAATDHFQIALLMRATLYENTRGLHRHAFGVD